MSETHIHLIAPAGSCRDFLSRIGVASARELIALVQEIVGDGYRVTGNEAIIEAEEDPRLGGRFDDAARAEDITAALGDPQVSALIMLRGGAWFTRILPRIDFGVLDRRATKVAVFGFSELTPMVNIVAAHPAAIGLYSMGPAFLGYGLKRFAATHATTGERAGDGPPSSPLDEQSLRPSEAGLRYQGLTPGEWMRRELPARFQDFFRWCTAVIEGRAEPITISARCVRGRPPERFEAAFVGGNLTVLSVMLGSRFAEAVEPRGRWLLLEDYNDKPERFDRYLSHLNLAGFFERCAGVLLGDFHQELRDLTPAIVEILDCHLPANFTAPVLVTDQVGHIWPMTPVPLRIPALARRTSEQEYEFTWHVPR